MTYNKNLETVLGIFCPKHKISNAYPCEASSYGIKCKIKCTSGFYIEPTVITCENGAKNSGQWSTLDAECKRRLNINKLLYNNISKNVFFLVTFCSHFHQLQDGIVSCKNDEILMKTSCLFDCKSGFQIKGNASSTCSYSRGNGTWDQIPKCEKSGDHMVVILSALSALLFLGILVMFLVEEKRIKT